MGKEIKWVFIYTINEKFFFYHRNTFISKRSAAKSTDFFLYKILLDLLRLIQLVVSEFSSFCCENYFLYYKTRLDVFAVVSVDSKRQYRLAMYSDETVPLFGPSLPCPPLFKNHDLFRQFLLVKLINGEKATFDTPTFARKRERTLDMLIKDLYSEHMTDQRLVSSFFLNCCFLYFMCIIIITFNEYANYFVVSYILPFITFISGDCFLLLVNF